jgi:putative ABC transport system permease protein
LSQGLLRFLSAGPESFQLELGVDWAVLGFTALAAIATTITFGLAPAVRATRTGVAAAMKSGARGTTTGPGGLSFQRLLIVSQVSVSLVLLVGALLFVRSYRNMMTFDPGFRQEGIFTAFLTINHLHIPEERRQRLKQDLADAVKAIPRVEAASMSTHTALDGSSWSLGVRVANTGDERRGSSKFTRVSPGYFATMLIPMLAGRDFNVRDTATSGNLLIVNETFVRRFLQGQSPIGATVRSVPEPGFPAAMYEVVGVVQDTKYRSLREEIPPIAYAPHEQLPNPGTVVKIFIRTSAPMAEVIPATRRTLQKAVPGTPIEIQVFREQVLKGLVRERVLAWLSGFFGLLAGVLALAGLYGVIAYMVARRQNEIGIRLALGETQGCVIALVLRDVAAMLVVGIAVGTAVSLLAGRGASSLLFGLEPHDPLTLGTACGALGMIAIAAGLLPAWRASRLDPVAALRSE